MGNNIFDDENNLDIKGYEVSGKYNSYMKDELGLGSDIVQDIDIEENRSQEDEYRDKLINDAHNYGLNDADYLLTAYSIVDSKRREKDEIKHEIKKGKYVMYIGLFLIACSILSGVFRGLASFTTSSTTAEVTSVLPSMFMGDDVYVNYTIDGVEYNKVYLDKYITPPAKNSKVIIYYKKSNPTKINNGHIISGNARNRMYFGVILAIIGGLVYYLGNNGNFEMKLGRRWRYRQHFRK